MRCIVERKSQAVSPERLRDIGLLVFIILLCVLIQVRNPNFLTLSNLKDLFTNTAILGILAVGMMMVIVTRGIDLSIGATMAFSGMITSLTVSAFPSLPPWAALLQGMVLGACVGSFIGLFVSRFNILPIIATLGMMNIVRGSTFMLSGGRWVSAHQMPASFRSIATGSVLGVNNLIILAVVLYVLIWFFINHTRTGRRIYAVGSNPEAAEVIGIPRRRILLLVYLLMGILAGLAGVLWVSRFASAQSDTAMGYELRVIAACVLGGVSIAGGRGKVSGLILGVVLFGILANALPLIKVSPFWQQAIQGVVILSAVILNVIIKRGNDTRSQRRRTI